MALTRGDILAALSVVLAIVAIVVSIFQTEIKEASCPFFGLFCPAAATVDVLAFDAWSSGGSAFVYVSARLGSETPLLMAQPGPMECGDYIGVNTESGKFVQGSVFSLTPDVSVPKPPQIPNNAPPNPYINNMDLVLRRFFIWRLHLRFAHGETNPVTVDAIYFRPRGSEPDHDRETVVIEPVGRAQCDIALPLSGINEPGHYEIEVTVQGWGVKTTVAKVGFAITSP